MNNTTEQRHREYHRLLHLKPAVEASLSAIPGVVQVSVGLKVTGGDATEQMCYRIYVDNKLAPADIPPSQKIPASINGVATDVNEISKLITGSVNLDEGKYRPLTGGSRIFSSQGPGPGTLGCFAIDDITQKPVLLSNYHVLMANGEEKGHQIAQPDFRCDGCCCRCGEIARLERGLFGDQNVDCAIATLSNGQQNNWTNHVIRLGNISCIPVDFNKDPIDPVTGLTFESSTGLPYQPVKPGDTVFKRGITSRLTEGLVVDPTGAASSQFNTKNGRVQFLFLNQLIIHPKHPKRPFSKKGDSGSVVVNHLNQVVGLHFADDEQRNSKGKLTRAASESIANPIQEVLKKLQITIPDTGTLLTLPLQWDDGDTIQQEPDQIDSLITMMEEHAHGPELVNAFSIFRQEVMHLVNHNREVTVAWHRHQGPAFIAQLLRKASQPAYEIPLSIQGITWQRMLSKMSVVLEKNGTPELATAIETHTMKVLDLINDLFPALNQRFHQQH